MKRVKGILLMAGQGERFGDPIPKQFHLLNGKPLYQWTLERLENSKLFDEIILVCPPENVKEVQSATTNTVIPGGSTRQESSYLGLIAAAGADIVLIHDAVRPSVSERILRENIEKALLHRAVDTCIPSTDTIVYSPTGTTIETIPCRREYLRGQTPQTFSYNLILEAHRKTKTTNATDDCQLVLELKKKIYIVKGEEENGKITSLRDFQLLAAASELPKI